MTEGDSPSPAPLPASGAEFQVPETEAELAAVPVQAAATVLIVRDGPGANLETLLLQRRAGSVFVPGVHVFPGGRVDDQDYALVEAGSTTGWPGGVRSVDQERRQTVDRVGGEGNDIDGGLPKDLAFWVAALRETFEETGLLLARLAEGPDAGASDGAGERWAATMAAVRQERPAVDAGVRSMLEVCGDHGVVLDTASMVYFGHWTTPMGAPRRYDTQFFVARCPSGQEVEPDGVEAVDAIWRQPREALQANLAGEIDLIAPTYRSLVALTRFSTTKEVLAALWPHGAKSGRMVADEGGGFRVSLPPWDSKDPHATQGSEPFPRIPPEIRARRGTND